MAPGLIEPDAGYFENTSANKSVFPDGLRTTGQSEPIYSLVQPYDSFPKEITGPTLWKAEDYRDNPERWTHAFTDDEITEIEAAADKFIDQGHPLTGISKVLLHFFTASSKSSSTSL